MRNRLSAHANILNVSLAYLWHNAAAPLRLNQEVKMEGKVEIEDLWRFVESNENQFPIFMKLFEEADDPSVRRELVILTLDANSFFQRHIADLGFSSREEIDEENKQQTHSFLSRVEHLHEAATEAKKGSDFVSGLDLGKLQEGLVAIFICCLDQDWNNILVQYRTVSMFAALIEHLLRDNASVSWLRWQLDLTGSAAEQAQVPDMTYREGICSMNVNPEYDIMLSVLNVTVSLSEQSIIYTDHPGFIHLYVPTLPKGNENVLKLMTLRDSKYYFSALKFKNTIHKMLNELKMTSGQSKEQELGDFELKIGPHGPAVQMDEMYFADENPSLSYDVVPAIKFSSWPVCCLEWAQRKRLWPPQTLVDEIIQEGFHLVPKVSSLHGDEDLDWRFSFSKAEAKLMTAKGLGNRNYCYRIFKMAIKENISSTCSLLTSYHLKTLLLWASERQPPARWSDENLSVCFLGLLDDLLHSLVNGSCPHYFIAELNLFSNCSTDHLHYLACQVSAIRKSPLKHLKRPWEDPKVAYDNFIDSMTEWKDMDYDEIK